MNSYDEQAVRVVKGGPTDEELTALLLVLRARAQRRVPSAAPGSSRGWIDRSRLMRRYPRAGAGAWRATAWVDR